MVEAFATLKDFEGIGVVQLEKIDIVLHRLVQNIVQAYKDKQDREVLTRKSQGGDANSRSL
jgi:phosphate starvation-inducible protein PhoH